MLTCIACSKQVSGRSLHEQEEGEGEAVATPSTKHAIKALTAQVMEQLCLVAEKMKNSEEKKKQRKKKKNVQKQKKLN